MTEIKTMLPTKKARVAFFKEKLGNDPRWAIRGLLRIYAEQTEDEQEYESTTEHNGVGFTGTDAEILTSFAKQFKQRGRLSEKQMALVYKKMPKYAGQLLKLSNAQEEKATVAA